MHTISDGLKDIVRGCSRGSCCQGSTHLAPNCIPFPNENTNNSCQSTLEAAPAWSLPIARDDPVEPAVVADSGGVGVKLIDLGNCFSVTGTDTSRISFEMQSLPFRAPEVCCPYSL